MPPERQPRLVPRVELVCLPGLTVGAAQHACGVGSLRILQSPVLRRLPRLAELLTDHKRHISSWPFPCLHLNQVCAP
jgi:hypothetical protein